MNYKKKWQSNLLRQLRSKGALEVYTRNAAEIKYLTELKEAGKIEVEITASGTWTCRLKGGQQ
jgi:hypothetical protein